MFRALTIAGSDTCGGAGIQADLKSFSANGVYGMSVITAVTAQNTMGVFGIQDINPEMIEAQVDVIFNDIRVDAIKIGMVSKIESIKSISKSLKKVGKLPMIVLDPVMISKSGFNLLSKDAKETLIHELFPLATLITPNLPEAEEILGIEIKTLDDMKQSALKLKELGPKAVLVKGGHLEGEATDLLFDGKEFIILPQKRINTTHTHGTGCTLSSAIAANLAKGMTIEAAVRQGKKYVTTAIEHGFELGKGVGPTNHFYELYKKAGI
ncbi:bifunctional hydroxymethylpyrimidine kinase/phosphomethylpyrimidine kinase [Clostridium saccharobutylicum]|uniref:Hydroxymethylpyrimidine/phosphomethylpyrimidine kinase n=1 Tax=Clostridium saccharobutylicum DSM 13864 TaxID=1345695 RepID=U5MMJ0_CLOSA|nr:bifunctional hydroxymethylpyrimidine kinase/phosphomethylpyrimidine kinase [Clostridium saccharobutylicum]AGX41748.1 thiD: hydroxymethylpyrimidine/phosphomethylpyrimidine kinase [Clostridium saccharobutylicum DSM 13864]AQR89027.1 hydroxymethylpyrimidine/phosphomethylpyrimidine kinase [Clostridium saccharobutylicum]AQR98928.1 hydroxymethylpyrimidine/phosphomethylpyrimidine kinase [Clostridium saccharobutylicum]AQS08647.1 hydroxymethylpyrimidine/phosphomethylpyrimidine kinase [Clostridium sacc